MSDTTEVGAAAKRLLRADPQELRDQVSDDELQGLLTSLGRAYVSRREEGAGFYPVAESFNATEASVLATGIVAAAGLQMFELSLWNSWGNIV